MLPGIRQFLVKLTDTVISQNVVPATVGLIVPIAAYEKQRLKFWVPIAVGATGGVRLQLVVPAGGVDFINSVLIIDTVAGTQVASLQLASNVIVDPLADAGDHWIEVNAIVQNGATAGNVDLKFAQDTSDVESLTIYTDAFVDVLKY